jgi:hypothetical protein
VARAVALEIITDSLSRVSGFSIILDSSTILGMSYLDVRVRFIIKSTNFNFHMLAIPLYDHHTGEHMFDVLVKFLDAVYSQWCHNPSLTLVSRSWQRS